MEHVIIRVGRTVKHSESWNDKPMGRFIVEDVSPQGGRRACHRDFESLLQAACKVWALHRRRDAINAMPIGNSYAFLGVAFGWLCPRPVYLPTRQSKPLLVLLIAGRCECLLHYLARLLFVKEGFGELPEDNSSSARALASLGIMGFFPLLRTVGCFACPPSSASPSLRSCLFSTCTRRQSFSRCKRLACSCSSLMCLACSSCFLSIS